MATKSGKKGKKAKGKSLPLQEFWAANGGVKTPASSSLVTKTVTSWADEVEEEENYRPPQTFSLPTAPRASRIYDDLSDDPPFSVQIRNLSYDTVEADLVEFFYEQQIVSIVIPEGESGRNRGIAFVEFETKNDLIAAINMPEPSLNNRIIKIDLPQESDNNRRGGRMNNRGNSRYDNFGGSGGEMDNSNWRDGNKNNDDGGGGRRGGGGGGGFGYNRGGERGERNRDPSPEGGNWRLELKDPESPPPMRRGGDRDRGGFNDRNRDDYGRGGDRYGGDRGGRRNYDDRPNDMPAERPKLNLAPRTLPLPEIKIAASDLIKDNDGSESDSREKTEVDPPKPKPTPVPAAAIFGSAKPVDTTAREREIEERMERERSEQIKARELEKEKAAAAASTVTEEKIEKVAEVVDPEANSWRRRTDDDDNAPRTQSPPRRGARRYDDRNDRRGGDRDYNRDRDGGRDGGGSNRDVGNDNRDYNRRDNRDYRDTRNRDHNRDNRGGGGDKYNSNNRGGDRRDHRDNKQYRDDNKPMRREKEAPVPFDDDDTIEKENNDGTAITPTDGVAAVKEARLPKYEAPTKPKLQMSNKYEFLDDASDD